MWNQFENLALKIYCVQNISDAVTGHELCLVGCAAYESQICVRRKIKFRQFEIKDCKKLKISINYFLSNYEKHINHRCPCQQLKIQSYVCKRIWKKFKCTILCSLNQIRFCKIICNVWSYIVSHKIGNTSTNVFGKGTY